ncbi:hypothetical protein IIA29_09815, partial [candidate division KSB1 bacterium]|nr:hypothetical protein [candidate division KSB1 bacterium]
TITSEIVGDELHAVIEAVSDTGDTIDLLSIAATVHTPGGKPVPMRFVQTAPGRYEATAPATESGSYVIIAKPRRGSQTLPPIIGGASVAAGVEYRSLNSNRRLLERISEETGGRVLDMDDPASANLFDRSGLSPSISHLPIWRTLLVWTLFVFLLDVGTRRVAWDRLIGTQFGVGLRAAAAEALTELPVNACTDITGFGLLGHLKEMARGSGVNVEISADSVPVLEAAKEFITANVIPGGTLNNMEYVADVVTWSPEISRTLRTLLCDAQTSGGLLISVPAEHSEKATETLLAKGVKAAKIIGQVTGPSDGRIVVRPG